MDKIICNSGPLIALTGIRRLDLLQSLFGEVFISEIVRDELLAGQQDHQGGVALFAAAPWLKIIPAEPGRDPLLSAMLDEGEAATITLALHQSAALVLMDEVKGRRIARDIYGLAVIGTGRVLVEAKKAGLISKVRPWLHQMKENGYWLADRIVMEILRQANEPED